MLNSFVLILLAVIPFLESEEKSLGFVILLLTAVIFGIKLLKQQIKFDLVDTLFCIFLITSAISTAYSQSVTRSFMELIRYSAYFLIFIFIRRQSSLNSNTVVKHLNFVILIPAIVLSVVSMNYLLPHPLISYPTAGMQLFYSTFGHNHLAGLLLFAIPLCFTRLYDNWKSKSMFTFLLFSLIFTYSRIAILLIILYLLFLAGRISEINKSKWSSVFSFFVLILVLVYLSLRIYSYTGNRLSYLPKQFYKPILEENVRLEYWRQAWDEFKRFPVIGTGLDTFRYVSYKYQSKPFSSSYFTHNHFLELFQETGFLGGSLFLILIIVSIIKIVKSKIYRQNYLYFSITFAVFGSIINNLVDYDWQFLSLFLYFWIALALLLPIREVSAFKPNFDYWLKKELLEVLIFLLGFVGITMLIGKIIFGVIKAGDIQNPQILNYSSILIPWQASHQQKLAQLALEGKNYQLVRYYNDIAQTLENREVNYYTFRAYMEDGLGNKDEARKFEIMAIKAVDN